MDNDSPWSDEGYEEFKVKIETEHSDSKKRRRSFPNKGQWPGKHGEGWTKPKSEAPTPPPQRQAARQIRVRAIEDTGEDDGWTCRIIDQSGTEVWNDSYPTKDEAKRRMRAFIRVKMMKSIRNAEQVDDAGKRETVVTFV